MSYSMAGSIPSSMPDDMYQKIMAKLDGKGVMIVVDATRDLLLNVLEISIHFLNQTETTTNLERFLMWSF